MTENIFIIAMTLSCLTLAAASAEDQENLKSELDAPASTDEMQEDAFRVLFIGNSITRHGANKDTQEKLGWDHTAGMAASAENKDYSHLLGAMLKKEMPGQPVALYYHTYGGSGSVATRLKALKKVEGVRPQLVVLQLGEHEKQQDGETLLAENYGQLINAVKAFASSPLIIAIGPWSTDRNRDTQGKYTDWVGRVDSIMERLCREKDVPYASTATMSLDRETFGSGTSSGVKWHPNDAGHIAYAETLFKLFKKIHASQ